MHQNAFGGPAWELTALPQTPSLVKGEWERGKEGKGNGKGEGEKKEREDPLIV